MSKNEKRSEEKDDKVDVVGSSPNKMGGCDTSGENITSSTQAQHRYCIMARVPHCMAACTLSKEIIQSMAASNSGGLTNASNAACRRGDAAITPGKWDRKLSSLA